MYTLQRLSSTKIPSAVHIQLKYSCAPSRTPRSIYITLLTHINPARHTRSRTGSKVQGPHGEKCQLARSSPLATAHPKSSLACPASLTDPAPPAQATRSHSSHQPGPQCSDQSEHASCSSEHACATASLAASACSNAALRVTRYFKLWYTMAKPVPYLGSWFVRSSEHHGVSGKSHP